MKDWKFRILVDDLMGETPSRWQVDLYDPAGLKYASSPCEHYSEWVHNFPTFDAALSFVCGLLAIFDGVPVLDYSVWWAATELAHEVLAYES